MTNHNAGKISSDEPMKTKNFSGAGYDWVVQPLVGGLPRVVITEQILQVVCVEGSMTLYRRIHKCLHKLHEC